MDIKLKENKLKDIALNLYNRVNGQDLINDFKILLNDQDFAQGIQFNVHPLGFLHSKLGVFDGIGDLRLHIWLDDNRRQQSPYMPIHDHIFKVNSFILYGEVINHNYNVYKQKEYDNNKKIYRTSYVGEKSVLIATDEVVFCELKDKEIFKQGEYYSVDKFKYHKTSVQSGKFAATLVLATDKDITNAPKILGELNGDSHYIFERYISTFQAIEKLNQKLK